MGFEGLEAGPQLRTTLATMQPGGVILFARNIEEPRQTWKLLHDSQSATPIPMFLCVDLEGGTVDRLKDVIAPAPSLQNVFSTGQPKLFRMHGNVLGLESRALGFNTNFAPVLDLGYEASRAVLGSRTASPDPRETIGYAREFLRGLKAAHVLGCGKHFPGLGEANLDTHHELPAINKPVKRLWTEDLLPYRQLHARLPFVMVAHAGYPLVTKNNVPASLSKEWITGILRNRIGYRGLILSDDLEMGGVLAAGSIEDVAINTLRAGSDMFLVCRKHELVWRAYEAVLREAERDRKFAAVVQRAAKRILEFKRRARPLKGFSAEPKPRVIEKLKEIVENFTRVVHSQDAKGLLLSLRAERSR